MVLQLFMILALAQASLAKVSSNFNDCLGQFYSNQPPVGFTSLSGTKATVCQMYEGYNNPFFASMYHKGNRSPLYSAYILDRRPGDLTGSDQTFRLEPQILYGALLLYGALTRERLDMRPNNAEELKAAIEASWSSITPQQCHRLIASMPRRIELVDTRLPKEIMLQPATETAIRSLGLSGVAADLIKQHQAINSDYTGSNYHKGHLNPNADHPDGPGQKVTYTLTNVAPMYGSLNSGAWQNNEKRVRDIAASCGKMFVVTGVVPGNNWISVNGVQRINIPSHVWSGYCCLDNNNRPMRAEGALAPNNANTVQVLSIASLQSQLKSLLGVTVTLFQNNCT